VRNRHVAFEAAFEMRATRRRGCHGRLLGMGRATEPTCNAATERASRENQRDGQDNDPPPHAHEGSPLRALTTYLHIFKGHS
jgi:hypothetical protein